MPTQKKKGCVSMFRMNTCASICWRSMPAQVSKQMQQYPLYRAQANLFFSSAMEPLLKELRQISTVLSSILGSHKPPLAEKAL